MLTDLKRGDHKKTLENENMLVDSLTYDVLFDGEGVKGYMATKRIITDLIYDISPPIMTLNMDKYMKDISIAYSTSEILDSAFIVWLADSNFSDISPDTVFLTSEELKISTRFRPLNQETLVDGVMYNPEIYGYARATNLSFPGVFNLSLIHISAPPSPS